MQDVLLYRSISDAGAPGDVDPAVFAAQMSALRNSGRPVVAMNRLLDASAPENAVILSFDGGFTDFATVVAPHLEKLSFPAMVYVPTGKAGGPADWVDAPKGRAVMDWDTIKGLSIGGVQFGAQSISHADLTAIPDDVRDEEVMMAKTAMEAKLGVDVLHFAAPYGRTNRMTERTIRSVYRSHATSRLARMEPGGSPFEIPRIDMSLFMDMDRWEAHLEGTGGAYLRQSQFMAGAKQRMSRLLGRG